ncbi:LOW QUALITY PROTEIN: pleckstrin homology domain-containing family G member 4B [Megaptera novaeangliae]
MALSAALGRGDRGSGNKDLESLDTYIQSTLSALYPPFEATAATVLWQLFSVAEKLYGGDGLRCLMDFLIPAKRALQHLQREACARYAGLLFLHEGWPLCIREKVVVQLAPLRGVSLRPGDFYLQITVAAGRQPARLVLKRLSRLGQGSEEVAVPETMYGCVFTGQFLELVNGEQSSVPLQNCLLTSGSAVYRTPWNNVTDPVFVATTGTNLRSCPSRPGPQQPPPGSTSEAAAPAPTVASPAPQGGTPSKHTPTLPHCAGHPSSDQSRRLPSPGRAECESPRTLSGSPSGGLAGVGPSEQDPWECPESPEGPGGRLDPTDSKDGSKALACHAEGGSPSSRRRPPRAPASVEARRWFRKSYMEALRNPMPLGSSSEDSIGDEACGSQTHSRRARGARAAANLTQKEIPGPGGDPQEIPSQESGPGAAGRTLPRRSRSWDRSLRSSRGDTRRASQHLASTRPGGLLGGQAVGTRTTGSSCPGMAESPSCPGEEAGVCAEGSSFRGSSPIRCSDLFAEPLCPEGEGWTPGPGDLPSQAPPRQELEIDQELLQSGVVTLPGTRDRQGRAVVQVCTRGPLWSSEHTSSAELTRLLKYLHTIPRKEVRELGLVILVDARKSLAAPALSRALAALQNTSPPLIHSILLLVDKESAFRPDKDATIQCELVGSLKALHKLVDSSQLTADLEGSFPYSHSAWICFRRKLEPFTSNCKEAIVFLQNSVHSLNTHRTPSTAQEVAELIGKHRAVMKLVLEDARLVALRLEGGTVLARLRREEHGAGQDCQDTIEAACRLYNQVDEEVHRLVLASNRCLQELESLQALKKLQERGHQSGLQGGGGQAGLEGQGAHLLRFSDICQRPSRQLAQPGLSAAFGGPPSRLPIWFASDVPAVSVVLLPWELCLLSDDRDLIGLSIPSERAAADGRGLARRKEGTQAFRRSLSAKAGLAERREGELARQARASKFCETIPERLLQHSRTCTLASALEYLPLGRQGQSPREHRTQEARAGRELSARGPWPMGPTPGRDADRLTASPALMPTVEQVGGWTLRCSQCLGHLDPELVTKDLTRCRRAAVQSFPRASVVVVGPGGHWALPRGQTLWLQSRQTRRHWQEALGEADPGPGTLPLGWSPPKHELAQGPEGQPLEPAWTPPADPEARAGEWAGQAADSSCTCCSARPRKHPLKKIREKTQSFATPQLDSGPRDSLRLGHTGVFIKGLEVASTTVASEKQPPLRPRAESPRLPRNWSLSSPSRIHPSEEDGKGRAGREVTRRPCVGVTRAPRVAAAAFVGTAAAEGSGPPTSRRRRLPGNKKHLTAFPAEGSLLRACESSSCQSCPPKAVLESNRLGSGLKPERPLGSLSFSSRPQHVMAEMISTERQYVRSLGCVINNYFPEMERTDLPQDLRGKRSVIFGNWETLYAFHRGHFRLECGRHRPWAVGHAFLRYEEQLGMSALYSKNKPPADALLCSHGNAFFRDKPRELGDKMDLASYLLKPAQRMAKYSLLRALVKEAGGCPARQELGELRAAEDAVRFQLCHGDGLLALDAVRGCDVDLKAQGRLRCQDEFLVCCRRKKHLRCVFPFEDLILFSKTQKVDGGHDVYAYKQSFKMAEIGMTENVGDSGLRFEIWFRRRRKSQDACVLQASSAEVKTAWTDVIGRILWRQALRSRGGQSGWRALGVQGQLGLGLGWAQGSWSGRGAP